MDGHDYMSTRNSKGYTSFVRRSTARGCRLCNDDENCDDDEIHENEYIFEPLHGLIDYDNIDEEECLPNKEPINSEEDRQNPHLANQNKKDHNSKQNSTEDEVVQKIVNKIYEKMSQSMNSNNDATSIEDNTAINRQQNDNLLMARLLTSISDQGITATSTSTKIASSMNYMVNNSNDSKNKY